MRSSVAHLLGRNYHYPVWNRLMEILGIGIYGLYAALLLILAMQAFDVVVLRGMLGFWAAVAMVPVAAVSLLAADFTSGFVHCAADNFGTPDTPFFGVAFIRPFRDHHRDPMDITRHDFVETNGNSCLANLIVLIPVYYVLAGRESDVLSLLIATAVLCFTTAIMLTNQIHKWAHMTAAPGYVRMLQRARVILTPDNHSLHHTVPFNTNYCITTGWMNGITERTHLFAWLVRTFS